MSWKGFKKAVERLPQRVMTKAGYSEETMDEEIYVLETCFTDLESQAEKLYNDARKYRDAVAGLLNHQSGFGEIIRDVYKLNAAIVEPTEYVADSKGGMNSESAAEYLKAIDQFAAAMNQTRDALLPELDSIDRRVLQPTNDFIALMKGVRKALVKREHKRLDFDRHRDTVNKMKANPNRDLNDEKKMLRAEQLLEAASKDYHSINIMLKSQLPVFLQLRIQFIDPCFLSLYSLQSKIFNLMLDGLQPLVLSSYFDTDSPIVARYKERHAPIAGQLESFEILKRKKPAPAAEQLVDGTGDTSSIPQGDENLDEPLPEYSHSTTATPITSHWPATAASSTPSAAATAAATSAVETSSFPGASTGPSAASRLPPLKPPGVTKPTVQYVRALYDYDAQADTDLSFKKDDNIEVVKRTADVNDWWTGKLRGNVGEFPGNYVADL